MANDNSATVFTVPGRAGLRFVAAADGSVQLQQWWADWSMVSRTGPGEVETNLQQLCNMHGIGRLGLVLDGGVR